MGSLEKAGKGGGGKVEMCHRQMHFSDKATAYHRAEAGTPPSQGHSGGGLRHTS